MRPRLRFWDSGRQGKNEPPPLTPVSSNAQLLGLMRAYWFSDRWMEAWALTAVVAPLTAAASKTSVWMAEASGELVNSIASLPRSEQHDAVALSTQQRRAALLLLVFVKDAGIIGFRHFVSATLHRTWRGWLDARFNDALLDGNHTHFTCSMAGATPAGVKVDPPDNIDPARPGGDQGHDRRGDRPRHGRHGASSPRLSSSARKLIEQSTVVDGPEFLEPMARRCWSSPRSATYAAAGHPARPQDGGMMERLDQRDPAGRGAPTVPNGRRCSGAASTSRQRAAKPCRSACTRGSMPTSTAPWAKLNWINTGYGAFERLYGFLSARVVAYLPGLLPYVNDRISLKSYVSGAELVNSLIAQCSWFIDVMPAIATLKANARRVTDLALGHRECAASRRLLHRHRPPRVYLRRAGSGLRPGHPQPQSFASGRGCQAFPDHPQRALPPRRVDLSQGESGSGKTLAGSRRSTGSGRMAAAASFSPRA